MHKIFENPKAKIIAISSAVFLLLTAIIITIACLNVSKKNKAEEEDIEDDDFIGAFAEKSDNSDFNSSKNPSATSNSKANTSGFIFESNGDGTCVLVSLKNHSDTELEIPQESPDGDTVTSIADSAFENCVSLETIIIPSTIKKIGTGAFKGCSSLVSFNVDTANAKFCSVGGVLFSKDKTTLICYPAMKIGKSYLLSTNIHTISAYAFDGVENLEKILYSGTKTKFANIDVKAGNSIFEALPVTFNYVAAK